MGYQKEIEKHRAEKDRYMKKHPHSPLNQNIKKQFSGLNYYPIKEEYKFELELQPDEDRERLEMETNTGDTRIYERIGNVEFEVEGEQGKLSLYQPVDGDHYFMPFRDETSGDETYGAGRYLDPEVKNGTVEVDFNLAYNPFCAYSDAYTCPLPPAENWLDIPILAGEKQFP